MENGQAQRDGRGRPGVPTLGVLDAAAEWRRAGGFRDLCRQAGVLPQITTVDTRRVVGPASPPPWGALAGQPVWVRVRVQGTPEGPARRIVSAMPAALWDAKFSANEAPDQSSFAWLAARRGGATLRIRRRWGPVAPLPFPVGLGDAEGPTFQQQVWDESGAVWEVAVAVLWPDRWVRVPPLGARA